MPALSPKKQRPLQSILRRKEHVKPEPKVGTNEVKAAKGLIKTSAVPDSSAGSSRKAEIVKQEENKAVTLPAPVEPPLQGGHYELNARMTRMVENELRDIMIKSAKQLGIQAANFQPIINNVGNMVWHELPDHPTDEAEALVVDKLRNQAGDDLRNVLGLNITKRLLNVHNPLYVKVQFSGKPEKVHLGEFLKKYNFTAFKRIEKTVNMFAAQVKTINDFDRICSAKDIRCGDIKVTVNPIYKFTKCPPNLVTSFYDQDEDTSDETTTEINEKDDKLEAKTDNIKTLEKVLTKTDNLPTKAKAEDCKNENVTKLEKNVCKTVQNKTVVNTAAVNKPTNESKTAVEKPVSKPLVENKTAVKKPTVENKAVPNKPSVENKTAAVEKPVNKSTVQNKTVANEPADDNIPTVENKTAVNKPEVENKANTTKPSVENKEIKKPQVNPKNIEAAKKPTPSPVKTSIKTKTDDKTVKTSKVDSDNEELDDFDILALMSEGIVLDECSGSDEE